MTYVINVSAQGSCYEIIIIVWLLLFLACDESNSGQFVNILKSKCDYCYLTAKLVDYCYVTVRLVCI